jgi:anti-anti-sigma factor
MLNNSPGHGILPPPWPFFVPPQMTGGQLDTSQVLPRHSHICNDKPRFIPYTYPTMPIDAPLTVERKDGKAPGTVIFRLNGPLTLRNMFDFQSMLRSGEPPAVTIIDLTDVPYMDSTGLGMIVRHYVRCQGKGVRLIAAGVSPRVLELFKLTKVEAVFSIAATVEEADTH